MLNKFFWKLGAAFDYVCNKFFDWLYILIAIKMLIAALFIAGSILYAFIYLPLAWLFKVLWT